MAGKIVSCSVAVSDTADRIPTGSEQDQSCPRHGRDTASLFKFRHAEPHRIAALTAAATVVMERLRLSLITKATPTLTASLSR